MTAAVLERTEEATWDLFPCDCPCHDEFFAIPGWHCTDCDPWGEW